MDDDDLTLLILIQPFVPIIHPIILPFVPHSLCIIIFLFAISDHAIKAVRNNTDRKTASEGIEGRRHEFAVGIGIGIGAFLGPFGWMI